MKDFDEIKNMWQQSATEAKPADLININNKTKTTKMKLQKPQLHGAILLTIVAIVILCLPFIVSFIHWYTYAALIAVSVVSLAQAAFMYAMYKKVKSIDEIAPPAQHLQQWQAYYDMRKKQNKWNMPVYYTLLNLAMAVYLIEIFTGRPILMVSIFITVYVAWMLFAYFYLGKKTIQRENNRLQTIINELSAIKKQLSTAE